MDSHGNRVSAWYIAGEAAPFIEYTFDGSVLPDSDDDYQFATAFTATAAGTVTFLPRRLDTSIGAGENDHGVFLNAFEVTLVPLPGSIHMGIALFSLLGCMAGVAAIRRKSRRA